MHSRIKVMMNPVIFALLLIACGKTAATDDPAMITPAEFSALRWLEGTWRGSGVDQAPFFERYHFENDTTLAIDNYTDSTLTRISETSRYVLSNGRITNDHPTARWQATGVSNSSVTFSPVTGVRNSFIWRRENSDAWTAILLWPATTTSPARERIYNMVRIAR